MAPMQSPRWAALLTGVIAVAGCSASATDVAPAIADGGAAAEAMAGLDAAPQVPLASEGLEHLVVMTGPRHEDGSLGSGCALADGEPVPDGTWYGFVTAYDGDTIELDVACVFGSDSDQFRAFEAAADASASNHVIVNDMRDDHRIELARTVDVHLRDLDWRPTDAEAARHALAPEVAGTHQGVWVVVTGGVVVDIVQPYAPASHLD